MKILHKHFHFAGVLLIVGFTLVPAASGDTLPASGNSVSAASPALPPADLGGWVNNGDSEFLFPTPLDPSLPWTSADNLATISAWQSLVDATQGDPALLALLVGMGTNGFSNSQASILLALLGQSVTDGSSVSAAEVSSAPEPALLGFLGCAGALLAFLAMARAAGDRARSMKIIGSPCPAMKASSIRQ